MLRLAHAFHEIGSEAQLKLWSFTRTGLPRLDIGFRLRTLVYSQLTAHARPYPSNFFLWQIRTCPFLPQASTHPSTAILSFHLVL